MRSGQGRPLLRGYLIGTLGYALGLTLAALLDLPAGAVVVYTLTIAAALAAGLLKRWDGNRE